MMSTQSSIRVLGVIPARGGSKGVPRKNIAPILDKPLIAYTVEAGLSSKKITKLIVSTDDEEIAEVARQFGAETPFMRPPELATDTALSLPVVLHALQEVEQSEGQPYDIIVLLQPTTPLRTAEDIDAGIKLLLDSKADSVVSVVDVGAAHPFRMKRVLDDGRLINYIDQGFEDMRPRQQLPAVYIRSGALYIVRRDVLVTQKSMVGKDCRAYIMLENRAVNIDTEYDFWLSSHLLSKKR